MTVTASLVVQFGGDDADEGLLKAEIDSREHGFNNGDTSFVPGQPVYYLVYTGAGVALTRHLSTLGAISSLGRRSREVEEVVTFADEREARLSYPVAGSLNIDWMGGAPGTAQLRGEDRLVLPDPGLGIATVTYQSEFTVYRLGNLPSTVNGKADYSVLIVLVGEKA